MKTLFQERREVGRAFESKVAEKLRKHGFNVYQNVYLPYRPGDPRYLEIDLVAISRSTVLSVECKNFTGEVIGGRYDRQWLHKGSYSTSKVGNFLRQNSSHRQALEENLKCRVEGLVVISDRTIYKGPQCEDVVAFSSLDVTLFKLKVGDTTPLPPTDKWQDSCAFLDQSTRPSAEVKHSQITLANQSKNKGVSEAVRNLTGLPLYCVLVNDEYFYAFTDDDGLHYGDTCIENAALFDTEDEAAIVMSFFTNAEVCTLSQGGIELLSDLPGELDNMTADEYADAVGARPW